MACNHLKKPTDPLTLDRDTLRVLLPREGSALQDADLRHDPDLNSLITRLMIRHERICEWKPCPGTNNLTTT